MDFTPLAALAGLAPDRRLRVASVLASPLQLQRIAGARSRFGSLSLASPRPLARDPRDPRNRKLAGTRPDSYKKERSRLEQASGHKGLPNAERRRRRVNVGIVIVLVRVARGVCVCVMCVDVALVSLCAPLYLPLVASRLSTNPSCGTCVSRRSRAARCIGSAPFVRPRRRCWR